jgi:glycerol-3-phosphate acyltransferase PlsX
VQVLKEELAAGLKNQISAPLLQESLKGFKQRVDHVEHGGGLLLGVAGVCIISHGSSQAASIFNAIRLAKEAIDNQVLERIRSSNRQSALEQEAVN